ncbi:hypothetical protein [Rubritalea tangerina]|uniref:hypothetical protein n=1 Tax=Rubritalea tangerina TaxID=430798 RepID=UPI0036196CE6
MTPRKLSHIPNHLEIDKTIVSIIFTNDPPRPLPHPFPPYQTRFLLMVMNEIAHP